MSALTSGICTVRGWRGIDVHQVNHRYQVTLPYPLSIPYVYHHQIIGVLCPEEVHLPPYWRHERGGILFLIGNNPAYLFTRILFYKLRCKDRGILGVLRPSLRSPRALESVTWECDILIGRHVLIHMERMLPHGFGGVINCWSSAHIIKGLNDSCDFRTAVLRDIIEPYPVKDYVLHFHNVALVVLYFLLLEYAAHLLLTYEHHKFLRTHHICGLGDRIDCDKWPPASDNVLERIITIYRKDEWTRIVRAVPYDKEPGGGQTRCLSDTRIINRGVIKWRLINVFNHTYFLN